MNVSSLGFLICMGQTPLLTASPTVGPTPIGAKVTDTQKAGRPIPRLIKVANTSPGAVLPGYSGTYSNTPILSVSDVALWTPAQMRLKRNEVYARYGRAFKSADLQAHFQATPWYRVIASYTDSQLTQTDKANIALIRSFEAQPQPRSGMVGELMFISAKELVITDGASMYGDGGGERHYVARGANYVVTWSGSSGFGTSSEDLELWTWSGAVWTRQPVSPPAG